MKKIISTMITALISLNMVSCVDQSGGKSESNETRIVATSVATLEVLEKLDIDGVVGIPKTESYTIPERYTYATEVGTSMAPDMEIIKNLNPTDVIGPSSLEADLQSKYENISVNSTYLNLKSTAGLFKSVQELGEKYGKEEKAKELVEEFKTFINEYKDKNKDKEKPTVLLLMGLPGSYVVATENSYAGSLLRLAGGINVYDGEEDFLNINPEDMVTKQPDIILRTSHAMPEEVHAMFEKEFKENDIWKHFKAVQEDKVYDLDNNKFGMSATFNYKEALEDLQKILYGEA